MTKNQRLVLFISILASFLSFLDGSVVNVALPAIVKELGGGLAVQQWISSAYMITLGSLILVAGSLSDIFGRKRILVWGVVGFGVASVLCAIAPNAMMLILARGLQGVFGALLVPSSLALIISSFSGSAQGKAIGTWTAWTGISFVIGPLVGGILVDAFSWRWIFVINVIPTLVTLWLLRKLPADQPHEKQSIDIIGAILCTTGLVGTVFALIEQPSYGWQHPMIYLSFIIGILLLISFVLYERRIPQPMLPLSLFAVRNFSVGNIATVAIYGGLSVATFLIAIFLQQVGHYTALLAGLSLLPITIIMFFLSSRFGALAGKYGPRLFMAAGPLIAAFGFLLLLRIDASVDYWTQVLPGIVVFGIGLSMTVAPLTSAILGDIDPKRAGIGSAINNAVSRIAGLIAVAAIGLVTGETLSLAGFHQGVILMVILLALGGIISAIGIQNPKAPRQQ
jgi:EmrB/QacA subfamily drug resistance transporter